MTNRVWFDARSLTKRYTTGWERYVRELANRIPKLVDVTIWSPYPENRLLLLLSDLQTNKSQFRHLVSHFPSYPPRRKKVTPFQVLTVHDLTWWKYPETSSFLGKNYYKKNMHKAIFDSELIICPSNSVKNEIMAEFSLKEDKLEVISHGNSLPSGLKTDTPKPYFLSIGTIEPRKNLDFYAQAIRESKLETKFDFIHVGRIGWGKLPYEIKHLDNCNDQRLANLILNAHATVVPSLYEGFGLPVLESHIQGTPVLMSNDPALVELSNENDLIFELNNLENLVLCLKYFAESKKTVDQKNIIRSKNMTWDNSAQKHVQSYLRLLK